MQPTIPNPTPPLQPPVGGEALANKPEQSLGPLKDRQGWRGFLSTFAIIIIAPLIALLLTAFVFQSYEVSGPSMETTLNDHDRLIVLKIPRTLARITGHSYIPHRGDIIVFVKHNLYEFGINQDKQLIKRVIGLPGDRVVVNNGVITIYNSQHPNGFDPDLNSIYSSAIQTTPGNVDITVPPNQLFVCGDNRTNSLDSRNFGTISANDIVGKLEVRVLPLSTARSF